MKLMLSLALAFTSARFATAASNGRKCACEAEEMNFMIDCGNEQAMLDALDFLNSNGCSEKGSCDAGTECEKNYLIVQIHHDYCPEANIPQPIEDSFYDFDESCLGCDIVREYTEGAPDCPAATCTDTSGEDAYISMIEKDCASDCSTDECKDLFLTLRVVHDDCPHGVLTDSAERGLYDLEEACVDVKCNAGGKDEDPLTCSGADKAGHDDHGDHDDHDLSCHAYFLGYDEFTLGREPTESACGCCDYTAAYFFKSFGEGGFVFHKWYSWGNDYTCRALTERMSLLPCTRIQGSYVQNNTLRICSSACDDLFDTCGLPGEDLPSWYNYTDGRSLCHNAWGGFNGSTPCDYYPDSMLCKSGILNIEVVDGDDCLGIDGRYPFCDGSPGSVSSPSSRTSSISRTINSYARYIFWPLFIILTLYAFWKQRKRIQRRREEQGADDAAADTLPTASATPVETVPEPVIQSIPVAAAVPEPPVTPIVQAIAVASEKSAAAKGEASGDDQVTAGKQLTFDQEMDIQSLEFKLRMEMITQEQFDEAIREIMKC